MVRFGTGLDMVFKNYCLFTYLQQTTCTLLLRRESCPLGPSKIITEINVEHPVVCNYKYAPWLSKETVVSPHNSHFSKQMGWRPRTFLELNDFAIKKKFIFCKYLNIMLHKRSKSAWAWSWKKWAPWGDPTPRDPPMCFLQGFVESRGPICFWEETQVGEICPCYVPVVRQKGKS